ncbi:MAG: hypothetical protein A4E56_00130 [Pelotomaculum sp. PtaU1.Bin065]|nr:MAG: hypothetical protein A4E56_00130 [Pelotomaculum sp. PtaU1.Bin065]
MAMLAGFLTLLGVVGVVVSLVMMVVRSILKREWPKKKIWTAGAISIALFIVGMVMGISSVPNGFEAGRQAAKEDVAAPASTTPAPLPEKATQEQGKEQKQETNQGQVTQTNAEENNKPASVDAEKPKFIPGIAAADIKLNLEKWGLKFTGPRPLSEEVGGGYLDDGKVKDPDTGVDLSCTISAETPTKIKTAIFRVDGSLMAGTISRDIFIAVTEGFLGYCATLPYDGAEPAKAKAWVEDNVEKIKIGQPISSTIGSVNYRLAGNEYFTFLTIKPEGSPE